MIHSKIIKYLKDKCIECDGIGINLVLETDDSSGVAFDTFYEVCVNCDNKKKIKLSEKRYLGDMYNYNPKF